MINMKLLSVVTLVSIYHGCLTQKTFWEEKFTGKEKFTLGEFNPVNMKCLVCNNVWKHRDIKGGNNYVTLDIFLDFGSLDKMRITSSDPKDNLGRSGKGFITCLYIEAKAGPKKCKKARYTLVNVGIK